MGEAAAIRCLGVMGETGQTYAGIIAMRLEHDWPGIRCEACEALGKLGDHGAAFYDEVQYCLDDPVPEVATAAEAALEAMGTFHEPLVNDLPLTYDPHGVGE